MATSPEKTLEGAPPISRPTHTTLTDQTVLAIQEAIKQGKFPPGSQLPPEMELLQMMGISRTTLREALRILEEQRFIRKRRGLGTFVMERAIVKDMSENFGIGNDLAGRLQTRDARFQYPSGSGIEGPG